MGVDWGCRIAKTNEICSRREGDTKIEAAWHQPQVNSQFRFELRCQRGAHHMLFLIILGAQHPSKWYFHEICPIGHYKTLNNFIIFHF